MQWTSDVEEPGHYDMELLVCGFGELFEPTGEQLYVVVIGVGSCRYQFESRPT